MLFTGKILICRPKEQAEPLALILKNQGWQPMVFPTVEIKPISLSSNLSNNLVNPEIILSEAKLNQASIILIQSSNSLKYLNSASINRLKNNQVIYAMGQGTQDVLLSRGIKSRWVATRGFASEHILNHEPILSLSPGSKILLLTGEGGRHILKPELIKKGFICERINTYKRALPDHTQQEINHILTQAPEIILATSVDILKNLVILFKHHVDVIKKLPLLVISPRIQQAAIELGWQGEILLADSAASEDILKIL